MNNKKRRKIKWISNLGVCTGCTILGYGVYQNYLAPIIIGTTVLFVFYLGKDIIHFFR